MYKFLERNQGPDKMSRVAIYFKAWKYWLLQSNVECIHTQCKSNIHFTYLFHLYYDLLGKSTEIQWFEECSFNISLPIMLKR